MHEDASSALTAWSNFYVITGSSAAALTGLMFVVITLVAGGRARSSEGVAVFSTPTVLHFAAALLISALLTAPWRSLVYVATVLGIAGLFGIVYVSRLMYGRTYSVYQPLAKILAWYAIIPSVAYLAIVAAAILLPTAQPQAPYALGAATLLLIFIGIHNAWDVVTFIAVEYDQPQSSSQNEEL
jgi:hypothetical protein